MSFMLIRRLSLLFVFLTLFSFSLRSQERLSLSLMEDSLSSLQRRIQKTSNDSIRQSLNTLFRNTLKKAVGLPGSYTYPFDSLKKMAKMTSPDKMFRIYNWNLPTTGGSNQYFCFFQVPGKTSKNTFSIIELSDRSDSIPDPEHSALGAASWYGALYFKIIPEKSETGMIYTLLGWEGVNPVQMQKVIEILTFDDNALPRFGKKIFNKYKDGENKRVIFKYSPVASMVLRYEEQSLTKGKKWNSSSRTFEESRSKASLIVCDRLVTVESSEVKGQVLVPAGDVYDGFLFENGRWNFMEGVDARNR
jgi:hypothetical protein